MSATVCLDMTFDEDSSGAISFTLTDLTDTTITPNTFAWSLTDTNGVPITSGTETPANPTWIVLSGTDLAVVDYESPTRIVNISGTYNCTVGGTLYSNLPYTGEFSFEIGNFKNV